ncbi:acetoacetate decarboxylase family protein [Rossellomorea sp. NPDC077527]|uniref:acetoacetate decarboxylase family protein n=1 Tax=Rossellomorea sp. NPDC077527 TaxID=3364510 RepID=UPI0037C530DE
MKPTMTYDEELLDNQHRFNDSFFQRFPLAPMETPLQLDENIKKDYLFPTFYRNVACTISIFLCSYKEAKKLMPHPDIHPIKMPNGRSLIVFSSYVYREVLGIPPYNEVAMSIPVLVKPSSNPMILPLLLEKLFKNFGYYVFSMPVTSKENTIRGHKIWGLPKVVQEIDIYEENGQSITTIKEDGIPYVTLNVPTSGSPKTFDVKSNLYSVLDHKMIQSQTNFQGDFVIQKNLRKLFTKENKTSAIKIGNSSSAERLKKLQIEEEPLQVRYSNNMNSCFHLPNKEYSSFIV